MIKSLARFILHTLWGWQLDGAYPQSAKKSVIVVFHHTSNWDFPIGILLRSAHDVDTRFAAKNSLFFFPLGLFMRAIGGVAVERSKRTNFVDACADLFTGKESFKLTVTPEGTRSKVTKLKSGFYFIAVKAGVPLVCCKFDWGTKKVGFSAPFYPTGDYDADLPQILAYFRGVKGKIPAYDFDIDSINSANNASEAI
jgi:1-acyl-sn-glycerol-3-phosphate acyltransferase